MAPRKRPAAAQRHEGTATPASIRTGIPTLPLPQYLANQGVLTCLLLASALWLPQTTRFQISPVKRTSTDRPEPPFLAAITADPAKTMLCGLAGVMTCMLWWTPTLRSWWSTHKATERQERVQETLRRLAEASLATLAGGFAISILIFLAGASFESHALLVSLFALHLSLLVVWPTVYTLGMGFIASSRTSSRYQAIRMFCQLQCESSLERALVYPAVGAIVGATTGAFVFPLDWDRPWQAFPLPPALLSTLGFAAGGYVCWCQGALAALTNITEGKGKVHVKA